MNTQNTESLASLVQAELDGDQDFQSSLADLGEDEKAEAISKKREELSEAKFSSLRSEKEKADELAGNYKTRAEKAEGRFSKKDGSEGENGDGGKAPKKPSEEGTQLSQKDWLLLAKADVNEEDIDDVVEFAQFKKLSIADALKSSVLKSILADKAEVRKTAEATAKSSARPSGHKPTDDQILQAAREGKIPEPGTPEAEQLFYARRGGRPKDK